MAKLPTLLVPGSIRATGAGSEETPLAYVQAWLRKRMPEFGGHDASLANRILIVRAKTGSGKSTVLPVGVFRILRNERTAAKLQYKGAGVICTQPRVLTAIALATDVSAERLIGGAKTRLNPDMVLGETVGFQTGPVTNSPPAGLLYATAGVLAAQLRHQEDSEIMGRYRFIIVDEAHERALDSDMALMLLRNFYQRNVGNAQLPFLLLTSATFDTARYAEYFGVSADNIVEVVGRSYPIETHWPAQGANNYPAEAAAVALQIHEEHPGDPPGQADILIFMPGGSESTAVVRGLEAALKRYAKKDDAPRPFLILTINREVVISQTGDYPLVFEKPERLPNVNGQRPLRRIVVSTVVAETGITIDTLRYVIDCGWSRTKEVYHPWGAEGLITRPAPQSRIEQRQGRTGRLFPGHFYPLYTRNVHAALEGQQPPEIISTGPEDIFLAIVREQQRQKLRMGQPPEFRVEDMLLLDPPAPEAFLAASATAAALGFISARAPLPKSWPPAELTTATPAAPVEGVLTLARGYGLTALGHLGAMFARTPMEGVRVLLAGYVWGSAASDLVTAVAMFGTSLTELLEGRGRKTKAAPDALPPGAAALRAALPSFLVQRIGGSVTGVLPPTESEAFYFRARLLLADDFAEAILVFDAFVHRLDASQGDLPAVAAWCADTGLRFDAMLDIARKRDAIIEEMLSAGLNAFRAPARRLGALPVEEFTEGLRALKKCLYDGLRARLLHFNADHPEGPSYVSKQGLRVQTPGLFTDAQALRLKALHVTQGGADALRPRWILTDRIRLMPAPARAEDAGQPLLYSAETNLVSVLDGYVDPDPEVVNPRTVAGFPRAGSMAPS